MTKSLIAGSLITLAALTAPALTFYDLGTLPGGTHSMGFDVSNIGNVAVGSVSMGQDNQAFRWTPGGGMVGLGYLPGYIASTAYGVSGDGSVVVGYNRTSGGQAQAFRWTQSGGMTGLGYLDRNYSSASAVSANGAIITGEAGTASGVRAFRWTQSGGMQNLGTLAGHNRSAAYGISADGSTIVGYSYLLAPFPEPSSGWQAFRWTQAQGMVGLGWLPGHNSSQAIAASSDGSVIVGRSGPFQQEIAFRWTAAGGMVSLGLSDALDVCGDGSVVVGSVPNGAAIWDQVHGVRELHPMLVDAGINMNNWLLGSAQGISADGGVITGVGQYGDQLRAWMVVIPEPTSTAILALGLAIVFRNTSRAR